MRDALAWYLVVQAAGLASWPLVARALAPLDDRGWTASKAAGLLGIAWLVWLVCMLAPLPFTRVSLLLAVVLVGAAAWAWELRRGQALVTWLRARTRLVAAWEAIFLAGFILFAVLRSHAPAVLATEKPMDMAFLNGFMAAQSLPTQDTWLAGFGVPYYYFGYFVLACVGKLSGVAPGVAYNLAAATVPALAIAGLSSLAWALARAACVPPAWATAGAAAATLLAFFCGNLETFLEYLVSRGLLSPGAGRTLAINHFADGVVPGVWPPGNSAWWFHASRIIPNLQPDGINEFPFFSAFLSDLHPHFVAMPFELLVLGVAAAHVLSRGATLRSAWTQATGAVALGGLLVMNTWDIAPFWLLYIGLSLYAAGMSAWRWRWVAAVLTPFGGAMLYLPYFVGYAAPPLGLGIVRDRTPLGSLLVLFGWAIVLLAALAVFTRWCIGDRRGWLITGMGAAAGLALAILGQPALGVLVALVAALLPWPGVLDRFDPAAAMAVGMGAFAAAILLGVEVIFLDDAFHSRMNTVFKFHENAWVLAALAAGVGLAIVGRFTRRARWVVAVCALAFIGAGLMYPLTAIATRMSEVPPGGPTLDGAAFLSPDERAAVRWLADQNGPGGRAVIAEGIGEGGGEYSSAASMATYSGAATVLGWVGHELQWRGPVPELGTRQTDLALVYRDADVSTVQSILNRYGVRFVVVGDVERRSYGDQVNGRFEGVLPVAFRAGNVTIYRAR
jgi:YYY domain-containing protein